MNSVYSRCLLKNEFESIQTRDIRWNFSGIFRALTLHETKSVMHLVKRFIRELKFNLEYGYRRQVFSNCHRMYLNFLGIVADYGFLNLF